MIFLKPRIMTQELAISGNKFVQNELTRGILCSRITIDKQRDLRILSKDYRFHRKNALYENRIRDTLSNSIQC